jgi:hypothetical protein
MIHAHSKDTQLLKNTLQQILNPRTEASNQQFAMTQQFAMAWKVQGLERESLSLSTPKYTGSLGGQEFLGLLPRRVLSTKGDSIAYKHILHPKS